MPMGSCMALSLVTGALGLIVVAQSVALLWLVRERRSGRRRAQAPAPGHSHAVAHDFNNQLAVILNYSSFVLEDLAADDPCREDVIEIRRAAEHACLLSHRMLGRGAPRELPRRPARAPWKQRAAA